MADSSLRLLIMLQQIPREPLSITTQQLQSKLEAAGYAIGLRTVQRDLNTLSSEFPLIQIDTGSRYTGWAFSKYGRHTAFPGMDSVTALTVNMAVEHLKSLLPTQVLDYLHPWKKEAKDKLTEQYKNWANKVRVVSSQALIPPKHDEIVIQKIYQALFENLQFKAEYNGQDDRIVHPYGLVQKGQTLYLICRFYNFDDIRITALHRFAHVELLEEKVRVFKEFKIDDYLEMGAMHWLISNEKINLEIETDDFVAAILKETPISNQQKIIYQDDTTIVTAETTDNMELRRWLLSQGSGIKVLAPKTLKQWMQDEVKKLTASYEL